MRLLSKKVKLKIDKTKKYLLACSGGPDSMALFHMLLNEGYFFEVAFVNYKSRIESDIEEATVKKLCILNNIKGHFLEKKCSSAANFESEARKIRYDFFEEIIKSDETLDALLIAHNADDLLETYFIQKERKNVPTFYGIKEETNYRSIKIIRPLLIYEKNFLTLYCEKNKVPYHIDKSNDDERYQRNRIRKNKISKLSFENKKNLLSEIEIKNRLILKQNKMFDKNIEGRFARIFTKNIEVLQRFLFYFVSKQGNFELKNSYKTILNDIVNNNFNKSYWFKTFGIIFDSEGLLFHKKPLDQITYCYSKSDFESFGKCNIDGNCVIKPLKEFDSFKQNGHTKKTNRFFIDCKMPLSIRLIWPCVLIDKDEIVFVPRYRKNYKIKDSSKLIFSTKTLQNLNIF